MARLTKAQSTTTLHFAEHVGLVAGRLADQLDPTQGKKLSGDAEAVVKLLDTLARTAKQLEDLLS